MHAGVKPGQTPTSAQHIYLQATILYRCNAKYKTDMPNGDLPAGQLTENMHLSEELVQHEEKSSHSIQGMETQSSLIMQIKRSNLDWNLPLFSFLNSPVVGLSTKKSRLVRSVTVVLGRAGKLDIPPPTGTTCSVLK